MTDVANAHKAILAAEAKIAEAQRARDEAYAELDAALAARGWRRLMGAFNARLYQYRGGNPVPLDDVLEHERQAAA